MRWCADPYAECASRAPISPALQPGIASGSRAWPAPGCLQSRVYKVYTLYPISTLYPPGRPPILHCRPAPGHAPLGLRAHPWALNPHPDRAGDRTWCRFAAGCTSSSSSLSQTCTFRCRGAAPPVSGDISDCRGAAPPVSGDTSVCRWGAGGCCACGVTSGRCGAQLLCSDTCTALLSEVPWVPVASGGDAACVSNASVHHPGYRV